MAPPWRSGGAFESLASPAAAGMVVVDRSNARWPGDRSVRPRRAGPLAGARPRSRGGAGVGVRAWCARARAIGGTLDGPPGAGWRVGGSGRRGVGVHSVLTRGLRPMIRLTVAFADREHAHVAMRFLAGSSLSVTAVERGWPADPRVQAIASRVRSDPPPSEPVAGHSPPGCPIRPLRAADPYAYGLAALRSYPPTAGAPSIAPDSC